MRKTTPKLMTPLVTAALLAGCGGEDTDEIEMDDTAMPPAEEVEAPTPEERGASAATLTVNQHQGRPYITDNEGRALYLLEGSPEGQVGCTDACAEMWPPYVSSAGDVQASASELDEGMIGTITRPDGTTQVTYGGHALYYYAEDTGPGSTAGQDVHDEWGEWYLVTPEGDPLEMHEEGGERG